MRTTRCLLVGAAALTWALTMEGMGQTPVITSLRGARELTWTNTVNTNAVYRGKRASRLDMPFSFPVATERANTSKSFTVTDEADSATAFYRVEMYTNWPSGMVWIDGGDVELGDTQGIGEPNERPVHTNFISGFWMDATEVTKAQWDAVAGWAATNGYDITAEDGAGKADDHPVLMVNWYECVKWCNARSQREGLTPCYYTNAALATIYTNGIVDVQTNWVNWSATGYRLPTEAEWEKAARGSRRGRLFPWGGDTIQHARANYYANTNDYSYDTSPTQGYHPGYTNEPMPYTSPGGSFPANGYGLYDMAGNVNEWCWDWTGDYTNVYQIDPHGPATGQYQAVRVMRGGSWNSVAWVVKVSFRNYGDPSAQYSGTGFRCARRP